jgi:hypothetical protein
MLMMSRVGGISARVLFCCLITLSDAREELKRQASMRLIAWGAASLRRAPEDAPGALQLYGPDERRSHHQLRGLWLAGGMDRRGDS